MNVTFKASVCAMVATVAGFVATIDGGMAYGQQQEKTTPIPRYVVLPRKNTRFAPLAASLSTWTYGWTYAGSTYSASIVGSDPSGNATTTVPVFIIPIKIVVAGQAFSPATLQSNGKSATTTTLQSPLFKGLTFKEAGMNVGDGPTQYIDAVQRAGFWQTASTNTAWHTLFGTPTVLPVQTIKVPAAHGSVQNPYGDLIVAVADINYLDPLVQAIIAKFPQITGDAVPLFVLYDTYLYDGSYGSGCCIGGYHSYDGVNAYSVFSYISVAGDFAEDVAALSHEFGELVMDPFTDNYSPCGILEVGDPLEGDANFGTYPYVRAGFTYHLQDLTLIPYFGAPPATSLANRSTFQGTNLAVCQNGS
jgi:hypothetical protein